MTVPVFTETLHAGGFLVWEEDGYFSREQVTIAASQTLVAGQVLGVDSDGNYIAYDNDTTDGAEAKGILFADVTTGVGETVQATIIARMARVRAAELTWGDENDTNDRDAGIADLEALFIFLV